MKALQEEETYEIPMTSLIDVVFLLLIFFLVATNFTRHETDHTVILPESESGSKATQVPSRLVVNIRETGTLVVNGKVVTESEFRHAAEEFIASHPDKAAVIRADARVSYQTVMKIFGICRTVGVKNVSLPVLDSGKQ